MIQDGLYPDDGMPAVINTERRKLTREYDPHREDRTRPERPV
jgi:hypothetical protein